LAYCIKNNAAITMACRTTASGANASIAGNDNGFGLMVVLAHGASLVSRNGISLIMSA
jgi:hypothetical protein